MSGIVLVLILALVMGVALYAIDLRKGKSLVRSWYNLTHKDPLAGEAKKGFLAGRTFRFKMIVAAILALLTLMGTYLLGGIRLIDDTLISVAAGLGLGLGFVLAPIILKRLPGSVDTAKTLLNKAAELEEKYIGDAGPVPVAEQVEKNEETAAEKQIETEKDETALETDNPDDWRKGVKDFLKK